MKLERGSQDINQINYKRPDNQAPVLKREKQNYYL